MDRVIRRACAIGAGLAMGLACGILALAAAVIARMIGVADAAPIDVESVLIAVVDAFGFTEIGVSTFAGLWGDVLFRCCVPLILIVLIGEAARVRSLVYYAGGPMVLSVLIPRLGQSPTALDSWEKIAVFAAGVSGLVYWGIAGRETAEGSSDGQISRSV